MSYANYRTRSLRGYVFTNETPSRYSPPHKGGLVGVSWPVSAYQLSYS